jgi:DNA-binding MarR family transcriptional regulator
MTPMPDHIAPILSAYERLMEEVRLVTRNEIGTSEALLLAAIGEEKLSPGELRGTYYFGTNATYTLKRLQEDGYLIIDGDKRDRRGKLISLTPKGLELSDRLRKSLARERERKAA